MTGSSSDTTTSMLRSAHPRLQPTPVYDPYKAPDDIAPLFEAANVILHDTPDPDWWSISDAEVVAMAFPDWDTIHVLNHPLTCRCRLEALILLRHRTDPMRWLLILGARHRLCPGRGSTMGQFFRFKYHHLKNRAVVGTVDDVMAGLKKWHHTTSWAYTPRHVAVTIRDHCMPTVDATPCDRQAAQSAAVHVAAIDMLAGLVASEDSFLADITPKDA